MADVLFYHLERQPLERVLPKLLLASLDRGWRVVVQAGSEERVEALASSLWSYDEEGFLPHGTRLDGMGELQPIWLTAGDDAPNAASVRFYVDGAAVGAIDGLLRAVILFDHADVEAVQRARDDWKRLKAQGHQISYWRQDESGRWKDRANS